MYVALGLLLVQCSDCLIFNISTKNVLKSFMSLRPYAFSDEFMIPFVSDNVLTRIKQLHMLCQGRVLNHHTNTSIYRFGTIMEASVAQLNTHVSEQHIQFLDSKNSEIT
jgi:hypothetical protein